MTKLTTAGMILIMAGIMSLILFFDTMAPVSIGMIVTGVLLQAGTALQAKKDLPVPCRLGFHRYDHTGYAEENRSLRVYECRRCNKTKKAVLGGG